MRPRWMDYLEELEAGEELNREQLLEIVDGQKSANASLFVGAQEYAKIDNELRQLKIKHDALESDTAPLSREELEGVLKEAGWEVEREHHFARGTKLATTTNWWLTVIDTEKSEYELQAPISAVNRRLLKECGVYLMKDVSGVEIKDGMHAIMLPYETENCCVDKECINNRAVVTNEKCFECGIPCVIVRSLVACHEIEWHYPPQALRIVGSTR